MSTDIILLSSEGEPFTISPEGAALMGTITNLIEDLGDSDEPIPLIEVNTSTLRDIVTYTEHYLNAPFQLEQSREFSSWEIDFFGGSWSRLKKIILASDFLQYDILFQACSKYIAQQVVRMTPDEIREYCLAKIDL
jgi:hypothetical protein